MLRSLLIFAALASLPPMPGEKRDPPPDVAQLRGELAVKSDARDDDKAQAQRLRQDIAKLDAQLAELRAVAAAGATGVSAKRAQLDALNQREAALQEEMGRNRNDLARLLGALEMFRRNPPPALLVTPRSAQDAVRAAILIRAMQPALAERAAVFRARAEELQRLRRGITSVSEDLFTSESALAEGRASIEKELRDKSALERQLVADSSDAARRAQTLTQQLRSLGALTDNRALYATSVPDRAPAALVVPADGLLVRRFGQRASDGRTAQGMSWRVGPGAVVRAPAAGVVEYSGPLKGWGGVLILNAGGGYHLVLAGLDRVAAASGRRVAAGEPVGGMADRGGDHGASTPELYLEVRKDGAPLDPAHWLKTAAAR